MKKLLVLSLVGLLSLVGESYAKCHSGVARGANHSFGIRKTKIRQRIVVHSNTGCGVSGVTLTTQAITSDSQCEKNCPIKN